MLHWTSCHIVPIGLVAMKNTFALNEAILQEIDHELFRFSLYRLDHFSYYLGDWLSDSFVVLLPFHYTLAKIQQGIVNHFRHCLYCQDDTDL